MDMVDASDISKNTKIIFNNWRLYFNVINLSDISNASGDCNRKEFLIKRETIHFQRKSKYKWPNQNQPHLSTFHIWRNVLQDVFGINLSGAITQKLGNWTTSPTEFNNYSFLVNQSKTHLISFTDLGAIKIVLWWWA